MATQLQLRRDTAADLVSVPPAQGEPGYDTTNKRLLVGDGSRNEGIPHASFFDVHNNTFVAAVAGGTADALTLDLTDGTLDYNPTAYAAFQLFRFQAAYDNTGAATLAVGGLAAKSIKKYDQDSAKVALVAGDIVADALYAVTYDGTDFVLGGSALGGGAFAAEYDSGEQTITAGGTLSLSHGLGAIPTLVQLVLRCKTAEIGYSVGDELIVNNHAMYNTSSGTGSVGNSVVKTSSAVVVRFGANGYDILHKSTGAGGNAITAGNWKLIVKAWL